MPSVHPTNVRARLIASADPAARTVAAGTGKRRILMIEGGWEYVRAAYGLVWVVVMAYGISL